MFYANTILFDYCSFACESSNFVLFQDSFGCLGPLEMPYEFEKSGFSGFRKKISKFCWGRDISPDLLYRCINPGQLIWFSIDGMVPLLYGHIPCQ